MWIVKHAPRVFMVWETHQIPSFSLAPPKSFESSLTLFAPTIFREVPRARQKKARRRYCSAWHLFGQLAALLQLH